MDGSLQPKETRQNLTMRHESPSRGSSFRFTAGPESIAAIGEALGIGPIGANDSGTTAQALLATLESMGAAVPMGAAPFVRDIARWEGPDAVVSVKATPAASG